MQSRLYVVVHLERLHVILLCRFIYDCMHLCDSLNDQVTTHHDISHPDASGSAEMLGSSPEGRQGAPAQAAEEPLEPVSVTAAQTAEAADLASGDSASSQLQPLIRVVVQDLRLDLPRRTDASDFYSAAIAGASVTTPCSEQHIDDITPSMTE